MSTSDSHRSLKLRFWFEMKIGGTLSFFSGIHDVAASMGLVGTQWFDSFVSMLVALLKLKILVS